MIYLYTRKTYRRFYLFDHVIIPYVGPWQMLRIFKAKYPAEAKGDIKGSPQYKTFILPFM